MPPAGGIFSLLESLKDLLSVLRVLAFLVGNAAAGFACRLAGGLALTAAALGSAFTEIPSLQGDNMFQFHGYVLHILIFLYTINHL